MELILWRHAEAEGGEPDLARRLTPKGRRQAERMAGWLEARLPEDYQLVASPAARAQETARALSKSIRTVDTVAPGAQPKDILAAAGWPSAGGTVLVVGHQPTLGQAISLLLTGAARPWRLRKGAICWLEQRPGEQPAVALKVLLPPDFA